MANRYNYGNDREDKWFQWQGQRPPERNVHITEDELDVVFKENLQNHHCDWKQNGALLWCDEGGYEHGKNIGVNVRLAGTDENNQPMLVPVGIILRSQV